MTKADRHALKKQVRKMTVEDMANTLTLRPWLNTRVKGKEDDEK